MMIQRYFRYGAALFLLGALFTYIPLTAQTEPAAAAPESAAAPAGTASSSLPNWLVKLQYGGWVTVVQITLSVVAGGYFVGSLAAQRRKNIIPAGFTDHARKLWAAGKMEELDAYAATSPSTIGRITLFLVRHRSTPSPELSGIAGDIASREINNMTQRAYPIAVIGNLEPLLGLLGTIFGMIDVFDVVAVAGELGDPSMMADGISKALVTTAVGLVLAIPLLSAYHYFKNKANSYATDLESEITDLMTEWFLPKEAVAAVGSPSSNTP